jgi:hypothetical protein
MGVMSKLIGAIVYTIKTPFTNGSNAYRYGEPIAALLVFDYFLLQGRVTKAVVSYASIRIHPSSIPSSRYGFTGGVVP